MNQPDIIIDEPGEYMTRCGAIATVFRTFDGTGHQWEGVITKRNFIDDGGPIPYFWQSKGSIIHARYNNTNTDVERFEDIISKVIRTLPAERPRNFAEI